MELKNGYKVIYDKATNGERVFYASKTGTFADAEEIVKTATGEYKLIYEKAGQVYGSKTGIPAEGDHCFVEFDKVFIAEENEENEETIEEPGIDPIVEPTTEEPTTEELEVEDETPANVEEPTVDETEE